MNKYEIALQHANQKFASTVSAWIMAYIFAFIPIIMQYTNFWIVATCIGLGLFKGLQGYLRLCAMRYLYQIVFLEKMAIDSKCTREELEHKLLVLNCIIDQQVKLLNETQLELEKSYNERDNDCLAKNLLIYFSSIIWTEYRLSILNKKPSELITNLDKAGNGKAFLNIIQDHFRQHSTIQLVFHSIAEHYLLNMEFDVFQEFKKSCQEIVKEFLDRHQIA